MFVKNYCQKAVIDVVSGGGNNVCQRIATDNIISRDCC